jgi:uncharacterized protein YdeI (YjbR/CyaY-like superfamily)
MKTLCVQTIEEWGRWLDEHHASEPEVWLVYHKKHTGVASIDHKDALDVALCVGWVDSLVKRLDERRYAVKFTPRRADSRWSEINRKRYAELAAEGRMKAGGVARPPTDRGYDRPPPRMPLPARLPAYIQVALTKNARARKHFEALAPSHRRQYVAWIEAAKRDDTKRRRLAEAIRLLAAGQPLGLK